MDDKEKEGVWYDQDITTLRSLQDIVRVKPYRYLEIGSEWGRSLVPHLRDPQCKKVVSIDLRLMSTPDERGGCVEYGVTEAMMLEWLRRTVSEDEFAKLASITGTSDDIPPESFDLAFIDGEHTNRAVFQDYLNARFYMGVYNFIVVFHDANLVFDGLQNIVTMLAASQADFYAAFLPARVFVIATGDYIEPVRALKSYPFEAYIREARTFLYREIAKNTKGIL